MGLGTSPKKVLQVHKKGYRNDHWTSNDVNSKKQVYLKLRYWALNQMCVAKQLYHFLTLRFEMSEFLEKLFWQNLLWRWLLLEINLKVTVHASINLW